jgi:L-threonylcarbamoyladenylate synthase
MLLKMDDIDTAVRVLKKKGIIIYPTETLYGLGCDISSEKAVNKLKGLKGRDFDKPISILVKKEWIKDYAQVSGKAQEYIDNYLPGALTLVLKKTKKVPTWITNTNYVGIRVSMDETANELLESFGKPITSTSANKSGAHEPTRFVDVSEDIVKWCDYSLNKGKTELAGASTVIKINDGVEMLREGVLYIGD